MTAERIGLQEAGRRLGVHYMTVYRYIRTGRLPAEKSGTTWEVDPGDLVRLAPGAPRSAGRRGRPARSDRVPELLARLVDGDEAGAWMIVESTLWAGATPVQAYEQLLVPSLTLAGRRWQDGEIGVADEHRVTVVVQRLIGRMGPMFRRRGPARGVVVIGCAEGERHGLATALAADPVRSQGFAVVDLGADVPVDAFVECARGIDGLAAVAISVTMEGHLPAARRLVRALTAARVAAPTLLGGAAAASPRATGAGAALRGRHAADLVRMLSVAAPGRTPL